MLGLNSADKSERFLGRLALAAIVLAAGVVIALPCAGLVVGEEIRGNLAYSLMIASVLVNGGLAIGYGSTIAVQRVTRGTWLFVAAVCLILALYIDGLVEPEASKAADTVLITTMSILGFPASLVSLCFVFVYSTLFMAHRGSGIVDLLVFWSMFSIAGYLQWFWLIPSFLPKPGRNKTIQDLGRGGKKQ
jgi:hypothetical protein